MNIHNEEIQKRSSQKEGLFFDYPLHAVWNKTGKTIYSDDFGQIAYELRGRTFIVAGDPAGKDLADRLQCFENFCKRAIQSHMDVCGYYFSEDFALASKLHHHLAGVSILQNLKTWSLQGGQAEEARRALRKGDRCFLRIVELSAKDLPDWKERLIHFSSQWRKSKGLFQIGFLLSSLGESLNFLDQGERLFVCLQGEVLQAVISLRPYGKHNWYLDQMMQHPRGRRFALDYLIVQVMKRLKTEGAETLSLGFCPGIVEQAHTWVEKSLKLWGEHTLFYSPQGLYHFKKKYAETEKRRYLLLSKNALSFKQLLRMEQVTMGLRKRL